MKRRSRATTTRGNGGCSCSTPASRVRGSAPRHVQRHASASTQAVTLPPTVAPIRAPKAPPHPLHPPSPGFCCYAMLCGYCASYQLRKQTLYGDMSRYVCCGGACPCSGRCNEQSCPELCLCLEVRGAVAASAHSEAVGIRRTAPLSAWASAAPMLKVRLTRARARPARPRCHCALRSLSRRRAS